MHLLTKAIGGAQRRNATRLRVRARRWCRPVLAAVVVGPAFVGSACGPPEEDPPVPLERSLEVTASAYNSTKAQTNDHPTLTAWGDTLAPGMRVIAVSRDLIPLGLGHGVVVRIEGLEGEFVVRDKMAARWEKKIDIYMGNDIAAAREWGKRELTIYWPAE